MFVNQILYRMGLHIFEWSNENKNESIKQSNGLLKNSEWKRTW